MSEATRIAALQLAISIGGRVTDEIILERARTFDAYLAEEPFSDNTIEAHDGEIEHHDVVAKLNLTVKSSTQPATAAEQAAETAQAEASAEQGFRSKAKARHAK